MTIGLIGVCLWPLYYAKLLPYYPSIVHTRLMIQGFAALFIFGFLATAGPRLLGAPAFSRRAISALFALCLIASGLHLLNRNALGDLSFGIASIIVIVLAIGSFRARNDCPPPGFPLAGLGLACGAGGSLLLSYSFSLSSSPKLYELGKLLLFQGFTLLPIVGVGAFFFPRILGSPNIHDFPEMRLPNDAWRRRFRHGICAGLAFLLSLAIEIQGYTALAYSVRVIALASYCHAEIPFAALGPPKAPHSRQLLFSLFTIVIGLIGAAFFPERKVAWLHAYYVVGLTGVVFLVSLRVVFGHCGRPDLIAKSVRIFAWIIGALGLAASTRVFADFMPSIQISHYLYAAILWAACGIAWLYLVAPYTRQRETYD